MEFKLVATYGKRDFEEKVNRLLKDGWILKGEHQTVYKGSTADLFYTQAMIKEYQI